MSAEDPEESQPETRDILALVCAWSAAPARAGEVALFPPDGARRVLGRGEDETANRVRFLRQRPFATEPAAPLGLKALSREQLALRPTAAGLHVERLGRCPLEVNGRLVDQWVLAPGDTLALRGQLLLLCTSRPRRLQALSYFPRDAAGPFGAPDAFGLVGESPAAWRLRDQLAFAAKASTHVLLSGATGTGKELAARAIHRMSRRRDRPLVARNAATLPDGLIDAELFGNVRAYPNPEMAERPGLIGQAHRGMLFLDELAELPAELQAHLLRVLDSDGEYMRLGDSVPRRSDLRLIAATNRGLSAIKPDLCARLPLHVSLPPIDARREDVPLLLKHLALGAAAASPEIAAQFMAHTGDTMRLSPRLVEHLLHAELPGNVRTLERELWQAMSESPAEVIELSAEQRRRVAGGGFGAAATRTEPTIEAIRAALEAGGGSVIKAAKLLRLSSRYALYRLMRKHGLSGGPAPS